MGAVIETTDVIKTYRMGKIVVACCGLLCILIALVLAHAKGGALSMWFSISAIASGGLAGLFLLAFFSTRANRQGVYIGIAASLLFTAWATLTPDALIRASAALSRSVPIPRR